MQIISKEDLVIIISRISDRDSYDIQDFETILERFGDSYYAVDGTMKKVSSSSEMDEIRKLGVKRGFIKFVRGLRPSNSKGD